VVAVRMISLLLVVLPLLLVERFFQSRFGDAEGVEMHHFVDQVDGDTEHHDKGNKAEAAAWVAEGVLFGKEDPDQGSADEVSELLATVDVDEEVLTA